MSLEEVKRIQQIRKSLEAELVTVFKIPVNEISEEEKNKIIHDLNKKINIAIEAEYDAKVLPINPNSWMKSFLKSFNDCHKKRITLKQAEIFKKNMKHTSTKHNTNSYHSKTYVSSENYTGQYNGKIYDISIFKDCGYLTIRNIITI